MKYQNPNFNKERYWKLKGTKQKKEEVKILTPGAPMSFIDGKIVVENRRERRARKKGLEFKFFRHKGYDDDKAALRFSRKRHNKVKTKWIPVSFSTEEKKNFG